MSTIKMGNLEVIINKEDDGSYYAEIVNLPGCFTMGENLDELKKNLKEATSSYILSLQKDIEDYNFSLSDKELVNA